MYDYRLIKAFARVVSEGGFDRAGRVLFISQSAVSQRIRQLEDQIGQLLLTRSSPPQLTAAGKALLKHYQQVQLLEESLSEELLAPADQGWMPLAIGVNADSVASWFLEAIQPALQQNRVLIDLRIDDQEQTHQYLRQGDVVGCVSNDPRGMKGCRVEALGTMRYRLLATPAFLRQWFSAGLTPTAVATAPAVAFNRKDRLHALFFAQHLPNVSTTLPYHYVPAPEQFQQMIAAGHAYGMLPDWQSRALRQSGALIELLPGRTLAIELYWHCWNLNAPPLQRFTEQLVSGACRYLQRYEEKAD